MTSFTNELCSTCKSLNLSIDGFRASYTSHDTNPFTIGRLGVVKRKSWCPLCRLVLTTLALNEEDISPERDDIECMLQWRDNSPEHNAEHAASALYVALGADATPCLDYKIELVVDPVTTVSQTLLARTFDPDQIDLNLVQTWLTSCRDRHGDLCQTHALSVSVHPSTLSFFRVIDVRDQCLVRLPPGEKYVALSYVWGTANNIQTFKSNLDSFSSSNAMADIVLPRTIRDAVDLVRSLHYRYLWIDSLCIVQDESDTKMAAIANMDCVYGHAHLTIIAGTGNNAQAGLPGYRCGSRALNSMNMEKLAPDFQLRVLPSFIMQLANSVYAHRAWTFQEGCFSARCLIFLDGQVYFNCRAALWREDVMAEDAETSTDISRAILGRQDYEFPMRLYSSMVETYTERTLSYLSDILHAFAGLEKAIAVQLNRSRIWYGIPATFFDWALLWTSDEKLERRPGFPSWSWAGWVGRVLMPNQLFPDDEQRWLLNQTWIDWSIWTDEGLQRVWDPSRDGTVIPSLYCTEYESKGNEEETEDFLNQDRVEGEEEEEDEKFDREGDEEQEEDKKQQEDKQQGDEEEDDVIEQCPSYGPGQVGNKYGRRTQEKRSCFPASPPNANFEAKPASVNSLGMLQFSTVSVTLSLDTAHTLRSAEARRPQRSSFTPLRDDRNNICGFINIHNAPAYNRLVSGSHEAEILILSDASPSTTNVFNDTDFHWPDEAEYTRSPKGKGRGEVLLGEWHAWDFYNAMLVIPVQDQDRSSSMVERAGLGLVHFKALHHALAPGVRWKEILMT